MPLVVACDDRPRSLLCGGLHEHILGSLVVLVPFAAVTPILVVDLPMLVWVGLALLEALQLLGLRNMEVEFDENGAVINERSLHLVDLGIGTLPLGVRGKSLDPLHQHASVPGAVKDGDFSIGGKAVPESPEVVMAILLRRGLLGRINAYKTGIKKLQRPLDGTALTGGIRALDHDDDRTLALLESELEVEKTQLELLEILGVDVLGQGHILIKSVESEAIEVHRMR